MNIVWKRFFSDGPADAAAPPINIAAMLAKSGAQTDDSLTVEVPDIKTEPVPAVAAPVAVKTEPVETKAAEPVMPVVQPVTAPAQAADWKAELKKAQVADVLKELGFDDKMVGFYNKWRTDGNITDYLKAITVDFSKMTPVQVMKYQMQEDYPELSPEDFEELYQARIVEQYKLDPNVFSETEVKRGNILVNADAKKVRESLVARQQEYILSAKPPAPVPGPDIEARERQQQEEIQQVLTQYKNTLEAHPATRELLNNKRLVIGEGEETFNYELPDPSIALAALQNPQRWAELVFNADGSPQVEKQLFLSAAAMDYKSLAGNIFKAGKALGARNAIEQIENAKKPDAVPAKPDEALSPAQALARSGVITT